LFVDVDYKDFVDSRGQIHDSWAYAKVEEFKPYPDMIVRSGGGLHCYWLLTEAVDIREHGPFFKKKLRALAEAVGGDMSAAEAVRILRIPGTINWKYRAPLREVTLAKF